MAFRRNVATMTKILPKCEQEGMRFVFEKLLETPITGGKLSSLGLLENSLRGLVPVNLVTDKYQDLSTVIIKYDTRKLGFSAAFEEIRMHSTDTQALDRLLATPGVIPWDKPVLFSAIPENCISSVENSVRTLSNGGKITEKFKGCVYNFQDAIEPSRKPPAGLSVRRLSPSDSGFVNSMWTYGGDNERKKYVKYLIGTLGGFCVENRTKDIVGTLARDIDGSISMAWIHPVYRHQGLIHTLYAFVSEETQKQKSLFNFCHIVSGNQAFEKCVQTLRAKREDDKVVWWLYKPPK